MRAHQCASNRWMRKHHKLHLKSQALLPAMQQIREKDKPLQCQSNHASFSEVTLAVRPEEAANGRALGMGWRTKTAGVGSAAAKIIASLIARSRATATNLHPSSQVWGEDVVGIKMPPTKQLPSRLQLEKVMMVQLQAQQLMQPPLSRVLMVQDWVLRAMGLYLVQPRRWKRGELQLPVL